MAVQHVTTVLDATALGALRAQVRGELIGPSDAGYEAARHVYNGMIDKHPALIVKCVDVADVIATVNFARERTLAVAVRGGGHSGPGLGTVDDGVVIDLSRMRDVTVDPKHRTVRAGGGALLGDIDHATQPFGLAIPTGFMSTTGIGGLGLGGGIGYLSRTFGLTLDNLLSADVVLADGRFVTASDQEHPDLYWALRGGGGNFGVVTSFVFRLNPLPTVYGGPIFWTLDDAKTVLTRWRDFILSAPEDINGWFGFVSVPPADPFPEQYRGKTMVVVVWCYSGPLDQADARFAEIRSWAKPAMDLAGPVPFAALQSMFDALFPPGMQWYWKADFFTDLDDRAIDEHMRHGPNLPTPFSTMHIYPINGAVHRLDGTQTAFSFREANFAGVTVGVDPDPANNEKMIAWARDYYNALHSYSAGGGYVNMVMDEGQPLVRAAYRDNYDRLARIKATYDPDNLFHVNQNIVPAK